MTASALSALSARLARLSRMRPSLRHLIFSLIGLRRERRSLARLDAHLLADIGLTPEAARAEAERPLWDVPAHWQMPDRGRR